VTAPDSDAESGSTLVQQLATFVHRARWDDLSSPARDALKLRVFDALGCAIAALNAEPVRAIRDEIEDLGGNPLSTLIGGGKSSPDRVALHNGAAVRYLDYNDCFLGQGEACHPSDNLAPVLAAGEYAGGSGKDLLVALAVAYQVQCRLSALAPVRARGFDHTTQGAYAAAAGAAKALGLDVNRTANAIAISGTAFNALRVTRTGRISHWKGLAYPNTAFAAVHATFLAKHGITGPPEVFEGSKGFMDSISGPFQIDWLGEGLDAVGETVIKRYNAEGHAQSTLEAVLALREEHHVDPEHIDRVEVDVFDVAYEIIGPGAGDKWSVTTKEEADHSLPYMVAAALLDGQMMPAQYQPERLGQLDVQTLLRRIDVREDDDLSSHFPEEHRVRVRICLQGGEVLTGERRDWEGSRTRPAGWEMVSEKFRRLSVPRTGELLARTIERMVERLEEVEIAELTALLASVPH